MRVRLFSLFLLLVFANVLSAKEVWLSIGGSVGNFRTDARIFNPSTTKDIQIQAYYLPATTPLQDNSAVQPIVVQVLKRQMVVYNDVVATLFHGSGLGAVRLKSDDDFVATQRIYAATASGSLGQFVGGVDATAAKTKGVIIQLAAGGAFRTNVGAVNPNASAAHVTWHLYDKNNAVVGTAYTVTMPPYAVISPSGLAGYAVGGSGADLTDAWLSYTSDVPIVAYGSVIDNGTTDPTYIPASEDTGVAAVTTPGGKVFVITEHGGQSTSSGIDITPTITATSIVPGNAVTFQISAHDSTHGFRLLDPNGVMLLDLTVAQDAAPIERTLTLTVEGTYVYYCTITTCSPGHLNMQGAFTVGKASTDPPGY